jgi:6-phosphofructokinase
MTIVKLGIDGLVCIGGDGTFTGAKIFSEEFGIRVIGIPELSTMIFSELITLSDTIQP